MKKITPGSMVKSGLRGGQTWRKGGPGAGVSGHLPLVPDLQDMSLVTLSTKTPADFFLKHQLVLHVAKSEMDKVRVFQANRESPLTVI